jgi:hypothetical protein
MTGALGSGNGGKGKKAKRGKGGKKQHWAVIAFAKNFFRLLVFKAPFFKGGLSKEFR